MRQISSLTWTSLTTSTSSARSRSLSVKPLSQGISASSLSEGGRALARSAEPERRWVTGTMAIDLSRVVARVGH